MKWILGSPSKGSEKKRNLASFPQEGCHFCETVNGKEEQEMPAGAQK